jgi:hypothetical protein
MKGIFSLDINTTGVWPGNSFFGFFGFPAPENDLSGNFAGEFLT